MCGLVTPTGGFVRFQKVRSRVTDLKILHTDI
eukprot:COSAG02_NODE_44517_length_365_cov_1.161654_2_plen_31_part_01